MKLKTVNYSEIVPMDVFAGPHPVAVDLVYADSAHPENNFGRIYRKGARLWLHEDLAAVALLASGMCRRERPGTVMVLKDGLRTVEAQTIILRSGIVRNNPHWLEGPNRLLSPPGKGAHPRAMAIDISLADDNGEVPDMGSAFDFLSEDRAHNPSARGFNDIAASARQNRQLLESSMVRAASALKIPLLPLPDEWWDFRLPGEIYETYAPLRDADLPEQMRMTSACETPASVPDFPEEHFAQLRDRIADKVSSVL